MAREIVIPTPWSPLKGIAIALTVVVLAVGGFFAIRGLRAPAPSTIEVRAAPDVVLAMRDLARLETASFHLEKVVEVSDHQDAVFGLLSADDSLLLVAVGDVVAGVDLSKLDDKSIRTDWDKRSVKVTLPQPDIFMSRLDNDQTHVFTRKTDTLAKPNKDLEAKARKFAEDSMRKAATDAGILDRARTQAERTVRATLKAMGFESVDVQFKKQ